MKRDLAIAMFFFFLQGVFLFANTPICSETFIIDTVTVIPADKIISIPSDDELSSPILKGKSLSGFCIGKYEVTLEQWNKVAKWGERNNYNLYGTHSNAMTKYPVNNVKYIQAIIWCNALSEMAGLTPIYYEDAAYKKVLKDVSQFDSLLKNKLGSEICKEFQEVMNELKNDYDTPKAEKEMIQFIMEPIMILLTNCIYIKSARPGNTTLSGCTADGYRLPTNEEWEYAARGGGDSDIPAWSFKYSGSNTLSNVGWYQKNSDNRLHTVGELRPNSLGIYDMSGNVWELTTISGSIYNIVFDDPELLMNIDDSNMENLLGNRMVTSFMCGGGYMDPANNCAVSFENWNLESDDDDSYSDSDTYNFNNEIGFRIARSLF